MAKTSGYSGTPLARKLGIKQGYRVALIGAPEGFERILEPLPAAVSFTRRAQGRCGVVVFFTRKSSELRRRLPGLARLIHPDRGLWVAWPKKSSGVATDLAFEAVQKAGLDAGLVDNKVCAIDETWSGLRFVYRLRDR